MAQTAEVVIIGAGPIGVSTAWHLAAAGVKDVLVLDRAGDFGGGSAPLATGGFRTQFSSEINIRISLLSREKLRHFRDEVGADSGYDPKGYLFLARTTEALDDLAAANRLQQSLGVTEARLISPAEARELSPIIGDDEIVGGAFCPTDGFIRAMKIVRGYGEEAARRGVRFAFDTAVLSIGEGEVRTARETISAGTIVNAAGAWSATLGIDVPVTPLRRQVAPTVPTDILPEATPMTIWVDDGFHIRERDGRVLLLWPDPAPTGFDAAFDERWLEPLLRFRDARVPKLSPIPIDREKCWAGLYEMTPDKHAVLGRVSERVIIASGSSGHGVMHAPALGHLAAELVRGERCTIDVTPLRPSRFVEGEPIVASHLL
jgi:sarcosine oxidase subunit beta